MHLLQQGSLAENSFSARFIESIGGTNKRVRKVRTYNRTDPAFCELREAKREASARKTAKETQRVVGRLMAGGNPGWEPDEDLLPVLVRVGDGSNALRLRLQAAGMLTDDLEAMIAAFDKDGGLPKVGGGGGGGGGGPDNYDSDYYEDEESDDDNPPIPIKNEDEDEDYEALYVPAPGAAAPAPAAAAPAPGAAAPAPGAAAPGAAAPALGAAAPGAAAPGAAAPALGAAAPAQGAAAPAQGAAAPAQGAAAPAPGAAAPAQGAAAPGAAAPAPVYVIWRPFLPFWFFLGALFFCHVWPFFSLALTVTYMLATRVVLDRFAGDHGAARVERRCRRRPPQQISLRAEPWYRPPVPTSAGTITSRAGCPEIAARCLGA
jgi:hypothetical protein